MKHTLLFAIALLLLGGCASKSLVKVQNFSDGVHRISHDLLTNVDPGLIENRTVLFTSLVNVDDFSNSSKFGRLFSESLMTDFKIDGWHVIEYRGTDIVTLAESGEFILNRARLKAVAGDVLVFAGTYGEMKSSMVVNCRLIGTDDNKIVSAASIRINDPEIVAPAHDSACSGADCKPRGIRVEADDCRRGERCWREF